MELRSLSPVFGGPEEVVTKGMALLALVVPLSLIVTAPSERPRVPYESQGACPGECCAYGGRWTVREDTTVLAHPKADSPAAFRLRKGDTVEGLTGMVVTTKLGRAVARKPVRIDAQQQVEAGPADKIFVLYDRGEGYWRVWLRGLLYDAGLPTENDWCATDTGRPKECDVQIVARPETVWWSKFAQAEAGRAGLGRWSTLLASTYVESSREAAEQGDEADER